MQRDECKKSVVVKCKSNLNEKINLNPNLPKLGGQDCWAPNWPIFSLHFHSSFHPFCIHSHIFTM